MPAIAAAQNPVSFGVKAGVNMSKFKFEEDDTDDMKSLVGAVGGVFISQSINDMFGWSLEGLFSQKGAKFDDGVDEGKYKLTYIDVPFLLMAGPSSSGNTRFNVFTGPQISFNTKAEIESEDVTIDVDDEVKSTDFGWVLGVGLSSGRITADARYTLGLSNISEGADEGDKVKNRTFSVMIGIKLK
jgi:hypothetical protein